MTPTELKTARHSLGLGVEKFARVLRVESERTIRRWERGQSPIPGCVTLVLDMINNVPGAKTYLGLRTDP